MSKKKTPTIEEKRKQIKEIARTFEPADVCGIDIVDEYDNVRVEGIQHGSFCPDCIEKAIESCKRKWYGGGRKIKVDWLPLEERERLNLRKGEKLMAYRAFDHYYETWDFEYCDLCGKLLKSSPTAWEQEYEHWDEHPLVKSAKDAWMLDALFEIMPEDKIKQLLEKMKIIYVKKQATHN